MCHTGENVLFLSFPEDAQIATAGAAAAALPQLRHIAVLDRGHDGRIRAAEGHPAAGRAPVLDKVITAVQDGLLPGYAALVHPGRPVILVAARDQFAEVFAAAAADAGVVLNRLRVPWTEAGPASARRIRITSSRRPFTMCTRR
ncbi:hypothetical protein GCM10010464_08040 [Pseudonocardia yunnanensis]